MTITVKNFQRQQPPLKLSGIPVPLLVTSQGDVLLRHDWADRAMYTPRPNGAKAATFFTYRAAKAYLENHGEAK